MTFSRTRLCCRHTNAQALRTAGARQARRPLIVLLGGCALTLLSGCSGTLVGHWHMTEAIPNRDFFCIDDVTFSRDGTYTATTTLKGKTMEESGQYNFNGVQLSFQPDAGGRRQYDALLKFNELEIMDAKQRVILRKG
jgi:hypothetical protein